MPDPNAVAFALGTLFGLVAARLVGPPVTVYVRQAVRTWVDETPDDDGQEDSESWKKDR